MDILGTSHDGAGYRGRGNSSLANNPRQQKLAGALAFMASRSKNRLKLKQSAIPVFVYVKFEYVKFERNFE